MPGQGDYPGSGSAPKTHGRHSRQSQVSRLGDLLSRTCRESGQDGGGFSEKDVRLLLLATREVPPADLSGGDLLVCRAATSGAEPVQGRFSREAREYEREIAKFPQEDQETNMQLMTNMRREGIQKGYRQEKNRLSSVS